MRAVLFLIVGIVVFVAITFFEQLPVVGWLGGVLSIAAWIILAREYAQPRGWEPLGSGVRVGVAGVIGAATGFVGALTAWLAQTGNLFGFTTPPGDRFGAVFGFVGASLGLLYWPLVGAFVCAASAFFVTSRPR
ncbi:MAG TPA: hypothetical protein VI814_13825 [Candidatus Limnocylindria bacterium]